MAEVEVDRSLMVDLVVVPEGGPEEDPGVDTAAVSGPDLGHKSEAAFAEGHAVEGSGAVLEHNSESVEEAAVDLAAGSGWDLDGKFAAVFGKAREAADCTATPQAVPVVASEYNSEAGKEPAVECGLVSEMSAGEDTEAGLEVDPEYTTHPATGASAAEA
jgi:hypothetical protein